MHFLKYFSIKEQTALAHAFTHLDFVEAARRYGKVGGYAHLATLVKRLRASRPHALLLDGGDNWQGSATSLWTRGADMIGAQKLLGVDLMTAHWEFTYGAERVKQAVEKEAGLDRIPRAEREDDGFRGPGVQALHSAQRARRGARDHRPGVPLYADRESAPHGRGWTFGIQETRLESLVDEVRAKGARAVVLLAQRRTWT